MSLGLECRMKNWPVVAATLLTLTLLVILFGFTERGSYWRPPVPIVFPTTLQASNPDEALSEVSKSGGTMAGRDSDVRSAGNASTFPNTSSCIGDCSEDPLDKINGMINSKLAAGAGIRGFRNKSGMLDPKLWLHKFEKERDQRFEAWYDKLLGGHSAQPPVAYPGCLVHVNHHYKFVWIKGKKVGGTSLRRNLGWICGDWWHVPAGANMSYCSGKAYKERDLWIQTARKWWKEYFVFSIVRNPYTRFASGYSYLNGMMGSCVQPDFPTVCAQPFLQSKLCGMYGCCFNRGGRKHHAHHVMEQSSCLLDERGNVAVDFIGEMENLTQDFGTIAREINTRRPAGLPPLNETQAVGVANNATFGGDYAVGMYQSHPECLKEVETNFARDFRVLRYGR